jgi:hypothetical protein
MQVSPRPLSAAERALVLRLLEFGGKACLPYSDVDLLQVVAVCDCGCRSFETLRENMPKPTRGLGAILADCYGTVDGGRAVGLLLWGTETFVTYTEVYSLAHFPPYNALPSQDSVSAEPADITRAV